MEVLGQSPRLLVDAAHNVDSIEAFLSWLEELPFRRRSLLVAISKDKQIREMLALLVGQCQAIVFTRYSSSSRGAEPQQLLSMWKELGGSGGEVIEPATFAWEHLVKSALPGDLVCATGSVFLVGEIRQIYRPDGVNVL